MDSQSVKLKGYCFEPGTRLEASWKGVAIELSNADFGSPLYWWDELAFARLNWTSSRAGEVAVNRNVFTPSGEALSTVEWLRERVREIGYYSWARQQIRPFLALTVVCSVFHP
jgi:hypothetical protein